MHYGPVRFMGGHGFVHVTVVGARCLTTRNKDLFVDLTLWPYDAPGPSHPSEHGWQYKTDVDENSGGVDPSWNQNFAVRLMHVGCTRVVALVVFQYRQ